MCKHFTTLKLLYTTFPCIYFLFFLSPSHSPYSTIAFSLSLVHTILSKSIPIVITHTYAINTYIRIIPAYIISSLNDIILIFIHQSSLHRKRLSNNKITMVKLIILYVINKCLVFADNYTVVYIFNILYS